MRQKNLLTALLVSAGAAYFFDKAKGAERRSMVKDKVGGLLNSTRQAAGGRGGALASRDRSVAATTTAAGGEPAGLDRTIDPTVANVW